MRLLGALIKKFFIKLFLIVLLACFFNVTILVAGHFYNEPFTQIAVTFLIVAFSALIISDLSKSGGD